MLTMMIFDLDGTLVKTEALKAQSYAQAAVELCPYTITEDEVIAYFKQLVGLSRQEVAVALVEHFELAGKATGRMAEFGVSTPWQAFVQVRLGYYEALLADPAVIRQSQWPHTVALLQKARQEQCYTALATMSHCAQVERILKLLDLTEAFDFVATHDDVERGKPDPEIYQLVARQLQVDAAACLVIEDSPAGVQAALNAGMWCIAVTTPFTRDQIHAARLLEDRWIVDDPQTLLATVAAMFAEQHKK